MTPHGLPVFFTAVVDEDGDAAVDGLGDLGIASPPENGAGPRVGVEEFDVVAGELDVALGVFEVFDGVGEEDEVGGGMGLGAMGGAGILPAVGRSSGRVARMRHLVLRTNGRLEARPTTRTRPPGS